MPDLRRRGREYRQGPGRRGDRERQAKSVTSVLLVLMGIGYALEVAGGAGSLLSPNTTIDLVRLGASIGLAQLPGGDIVGIGPASSGAWSRRSSCTAASCTC